jgi:hypothetical protein
MIRIGDVRVNSGEPPMDRVSELLARFPGPVTLAASKWKWFALLAGGAVFTGDGIAEGINSGGLLNWLGVVFFGVLTAGGAVGIFFGGFKIALDGDGFTCRVVRQTERWRWTDVCDFAVVEYAAGMQGASLRKQIGFNDRRLSKGTSQRLGEQMSAAMTGRDCFLPDIFGSSSFGLPMEDLARLMSQWQERALSTQGTPRV